MSSRSSGKQRTPRCELCTLAGAVVVISVLGAELGASVGEAAGPSCCATETLDMNAAFAEKLEKPQRIIGIVGNSNDYLKLCWEA